MGIARSQNVVSSDDVIEMLAEYANTTYSDIFQDAIKVAEKCMYKRLDALAADGATIVVDRTNLNNNKRSELIARVKNINPSYRFVGIIFQTPDDEDWDYRLNQRPGKIIPSDTLIAMKRHMTQPAISEGFDEVIVSDYFEAWLNSQPTRMSS